MRALRCVLARLTSAIPRPTLGVENPEAMLRDLYFSASSGAVTLNVETSALDEPLGNGPGKHYSLDLHHAVRRLLANPIDAATVNAVATLYGGRYAHFPEIFGIMFDRGFVPTSNDDLVKEPIVIGRPREGCAVFLDAIRGQRPEDDEFQRQVRFSTVHEIGHLFNLLHIEHPHNFLSTSPADHTYEPAAFAFAPDHCRQLARADVDRHHWPGGSDFADLGADSASQERPRQVGTSRRGSLPRLSVGLVRDRFRYFEPVELDVTIRLPRTAERRKRIPDALDPGYELFRLWIEEPNGERRLYRSPRKYCVQGLYRSLEPGDAFSRDISVFGQSGGYTFRRSGVHRLWIDFDINSRETIRSNVIELEVTSLLDSSVPTEVARALTRVDAAELLYHRLDRRRGRGADVLEGVLQAYPRLPAAPSIRYALGRTYLNTGRSERKRTHEHLTRAIDSPRLGHQQRIRALECLQQLKDRPR